MVVRYALALSLLAVYRASYIIAAASNGATREETLSSPHAPHRSNGPVGSNEPNEPDRPNMIFFFPDTLRAESFNSYGSTVPGVSPNFDAFAATGTRFEQCHVMHTQCSPSRTTMMSGRYMHVMGHRTQIHLLRAYEENYFRLLKESGYHIQWYGKNDALSAAAFNLSVSAWDNTIGYDSGHNAFPFGESGYWSMTSTGGEKHANDTSQGDLGAVKKAVEFMQSSPPEPFVIFLPTRGAHPPYGAPLEFQNKWTNEEIRNHVSLRPPNLPGKPKYHSKSHGIQHYRNLTGMSEEDFFTIHNQYLQMIAYTDYTFGVLLDGLKASGLESKTAVFASSDHGDFAGDFHHVEKWPGGADDVLTRVPLFARVPGGKPGQVAQGPVQTADIMETMLDLAGVKSDFVRFAYPLTKLLMGGEGVSPQVASKHNESDDVGLEVSPVNDQDDLARTVYSEGGFFFHSELFPGGSDHVKDDPKGMYWPRAQEEMSGNGTGSPKWVMLRNLTHKFVYRPLGQSELYDLKSDPRELRNVINVPKYAQVGVEMKEKMMEWLVTTGDVPPLRNDPRGTPPSHDPIDDHACNALLQPDPSKGVFSAHDNAKVPDDANDYMRVNGIPNYST